MVAKVTASPYLGQIVTWFENKIASINDPTNKPFPLKFAYYSAHDDTLDSLLTQIPVVNSACIEKYLSTGTKPEGCNPGPEVASQVVWELINRDGNFYVRVNYNGQY